MVKLVSYGANYVKIYDDNSGVNLTWKCKEDVILNDRVIEEAKKFAVNFAEYGDIDYLYDLYKIGWFLESVESV